MEVKVGDYIRYKDKRGNQYIRKIIMVGKDYSIHNCFGVRVDKEANYTQDVSLKNILKSSPNIIDLIEVGDYVNGGLVAFVGSDSIEIFWYKDEMEWLGKDDIITIVTKEQFESMKYKID